MVDAFFYMYVVGAGASAGIASVVFVSWKVYQRSAAQPNKKRKAVVR
ncbi:hypothetical protein MUN88_14235 [Gracilibacillus caseinilyticus]|uniref:Uncharacterized protein n=1 Tax=Gracilibacillus caseinilyticus TaxID=2932256 RepID=A0ABY4F350_9BACI|nr:hypothetical protein [Gracilibacillus caseinilyticus]UOQ50675.1 hypothetical protein MUN88_14235 [Gracilibacillus caseinilyticus]